MLAYPAPPAAHPVALSVPRGAAATRPLEREGPEGAAFQGDTDVRLFRLAEKAHMLAVYARLGGLLEADRCVSVLRGHLSQPLSQVARWIVNRELVMVGDRDELEIPMFQFSHAGARLTVVDQVLAELRDTHSDWEIALWFTLPDPQLQRRMPIELIGSDPWAVHDAARTHRFVIKG